MSESVAEVSDAEVSEFAAMGLDPRVTNELGYKQPSPIQRESIPVILEGKDLVGLAGTGTGKTAAFALPILHRLRSEPAEPAAGVAVLILTPTRELAVQVARAVKTYGKPVRVNVLAVYGGTGYSEQIRAIERGAEIIVATPGRALDLMNRGKLSLDSVKIVVLDEADEMLNMGFAEDMDAILSRTPKSRQTVLFSATMPPRIEEIAKRHLHKPVRIKVARETTAHGEESKVRQTAYIVGRDHKATALCRVLDIERPTSAIIFCRTRSDTDTLVEMLTSREFKPLALHGGLTQAQRDQVMARFRSGAAELLVATDIAARGLDISHLSHVVNFDLPPDPDQYIHRIGRVGRAGRSGVAITFATSREQSILTQIERATKQKINIAPVPTVKDLRASRLKRTRKQLRETLKTLEPTDDLRELVADLSKDFDPADVAIAALSLIQQPSRPEDETEIPTGHGPREYKPEIDRRGKRVPGRDSSNRYDSDRNPPYRKASEERRQAGRRATSHGKAKVYFGVGRDAGVTPRDLVMEISAKAGIPAKEIGTIDLTDRFALVEVPGHLAEYVVEEMQGMKINGRKVNVRADRPPL